MERGRREFVKSLAGAAVIAPGVVGATPKPEGPSMKTTKTYDVAVVGAR